MVTVTLTSANLTATQNAAREADDLTSRLPRLVLEARRISATVSVGLHGRRRAGQGENFWQYRALTQGETISGIDWRRSARHADQLYIREREWEAAHSVYIYIDQSPSMRFRSSLATQSKYERALTLGFALADCLVKAGERIALLGHTRPLATRQIIERFAEAMIQSSDDRSRLQELALPSRSELVVFSDCLNEIAEDESVLDRARSFGASAHVMRIIDPAEEQFPFEGETELIGVEDHDRLMIGDASRFAGRYRAAFRAHCDAFQNRCQLKGASLLTHHTDRPATDALQALVARIIARQPLSAAGSR